MSATEAVTKLEPRKYEIEDTMFVYMGCVALGDTVNTLPVIDFIAAHHASLKIDVLTTHPDLFKHHPKVNRVFKDDYDKNKQNNIYQKYKYRTYLFQPMNRSPVHHANGHVIDFITVNAFRRIFTTKERLINIYTSDADVRNVTKKLEVAGIDVARAVLLHPARSWPSRTLPLSTWQEVVDGVRQLGLTPVVIGKDLPSPINDPVDDKSMMQLTGTVDLTGKFSILETIELMRLAPFLITMDTAPIHLAGASSINIIGIFTVVHPEHRLPYRKDPETGRISQDYNTWLVHNTEPCAHCAGKTFEAIPINECPLKTYACIPKSGRILSALEQALNES